MSEKADISRIPPEILSEIFVHSLPVDFAAQNTQEPQYTQQVLSSVCRLWRALVLATPALWASLDITCNYHVLRPSLPIIRTHLQRSRSYPLSFVLRAAGDLEYSLSTNPNLLPVLTELATARERWWNVHIKLLRMTDEILDLITLGDAPLLQNMKCEMLFRLSSTAAKHRHIAYIIVARNSPLCLRMYHHSASLPASISAKLYSFYSSDPSPTPHLTHPTLSTLTTTGKHFPALLAALTLPALLDLDLTVESTQWDVELSAFLTRSKPTLRRLSLTMTFTQSHNPALLRILALTPHLRSLRLVGFPPCPSPFTATLSARCIHHPRLEFPVPRPPEPGTLWDPGLSRWPVQRDAPCALGRSSTRERGCLPGGGVYRPQGWSARTRPDRDEGVVCGGNAGGAVLEGVLGTNIVVIAGAYRQ
ncbi:hypothetical protein BD779DRAFT_1798465 [Infundibulicybe gibba]|nr:hypothetical protein BD779DRAFT_1798465 [Infundibulicybe gibba]